MIKKKRGVRTTRIPSPITDDGCDTFGGRSSTLPLILRSSKDSKKNWNLQANSNTKCSLYVVKHKKEGGTPI